MIVSPSPGRSLFRNRDSQTFFLPVSENRENIDIILPVSEEGATGRGEPPLLVAPSSQTGRIISIFSLFLRRQNYLLKLDTNLSYVTSESLIP